MKNQIRSLTLTAILAVLIAISGMIKLPSIAGGEFQMSAPIAITIVACFGFRRYITAGIVASLINLMLGTHTILNVTVSFVFRFVAGGVIAFFGANPLALAISGPLGTGCGRIVLAGILKTDVLVLMVSALPGMIFTAVAANVIYPVVYGMVQSGPYGDFLIRKKEGEERGD